MVNLTFYLEDATSTALPVENVKITPKNFPLVVGNDIITGDSITKEIVAGTASFLNVIPTKYGVQLLGENTKTVFDIFISSSWSGEINAATCIVTPVSSSNEGGLAYSMASSDARYLNSTSTASYAISASYAPGNPSISASYATSASSVTFVGKLDNYIPNGLITLYGIVAVCTMQIL